MTLQILALDSLAGIWPHSLMLMKVVKQLAPLDVNIDYVSCGSAAPAFCTVQESRAQKFVQHPTPKLSTCRDCKFTARMNASRLMKEGLSDSGSPIFLNEFIDKEILEKEERFMEGMSSDLESIINLEIAQTPVVRIALYEAILKFKKKDLKFNDEEYRYFLGLLRNSVRFALLGEKFFEGGKKYDALFVYAPQYSINNAFVHKASQRGVKILFVDGNGNLAEKNSAVVIWNWEKYRLQKPAIEAWKNSNKSLEISHTEEIRLKQHWQQLADGRSFSVYSSKSNSVKDLHHFFNLNKKSKIWTLALSSLDEVFAAQIIRGYPASKYPGEVFLDQYDWVRQTIEWVSKQESISLIIRMHPRDLPNKRENVKSEQAFVWEKLLSRLPENVVLNHPKDKVAIKDLLRISDGFLTGWSSTALEAMELGVPVVTYDANLPAYPAEIHLTGFTKDDYFQNLSKLVQTPKSKRITQNVNLWLSFLYNHGSAQLKGRLFEQARLVGPKIISRALNALDLFFPYLWRPLEAAFVIKETPGGQKIRKLVRNNLDSFYELEPEASKRNIDGFK